MAKWLQASPVPKRGAIMGHNGPLKSQMLSLIIAAMRLFKGDILIFGPDGFISRGFKQYPWIP